jgi:hypothetical protein
MQDIKCNADGSVDLYIGAKAPHEYEGNAMPAVGTDGWVVHFWIYAPLDFFRGIFNLPDSEVVDRFCLQTQILISQKI